MIDYCWKVWPVTRESAGNMATLSPSHKSSSVEVYAQLHVAARNTPQQVTIWSPGEEQEPGSDALSSLTCVLKCEASNRGN
jgi:hypothetical protein